MNCTLAELMTVAGQARIEGLNPKPYSKTFEDGSLKLLSVAEGRGPRASRRVYAVTGGGSKVLGGLRPI